jgi:biotin-dependent carboxylase-like uncharacterized protein
LETLRIVRPGPLATVQDRGRFGWQDRGVPLSGAMDPLALRLGNRLVGNAAAAAAIEITLGDFEAIFLSGIAFALTGAELDARLNDRPVPNWTCLRASPGDRLDLGLPGRGCRAYLALAGGIDVPPVMGSRSTYLRGGFGGFQGRALAAGDVIATAGPAPFLSVSACPVHLIPRYVSDPLLRVIVGPQEDRFTPQGLEAFFSNGYALTARSDRMGSVLQGPPISHCRGADIISDGIVPGAIQVPGSGQPIILAADGQTVGGYAKIATLIGVDLPLTEARELLLRQEYRLRRFEAG